MLEESQEVAAQRRLGGDVLTEQRSKMSVPISRQEWSEEQKFCCVRESATEKARRLALAPLR